MGGCASGFANLDMMGTERRYFAGGKEGKAGSRQRAMFWHIIKCMVSKNALLL